MYTWNKDWICIYESPWGIINKFMYANSIHSVGSAKELSTSRGRVIESYRINHIHSGIVSNYEISENPWLTNEKSIEEYGTIILNKLLEPLLIIQNLYYNQHSICSQLIRKDLYYCPECIKHGQHFMFQQFTFVNKCPIHNIDLIHSCPVCGEIIPYTIEFRNEIRHYGCKRCRNQLFHNDNFGEAIDSWMNFKPMSILFENHDEIEIPIIISNNIDQNLSDHDINEYLSLLFSNKTITTKAKYMITKGFAWDDMNFGKIITPNLNERRKIEEYVYIYAYQKLYRHISRAKHIRHKLLKAEDYVRNCCTFHQILNEKQIDRFFNRGFDLNAISLFLWKRDMEYGNYTNHGYYMNKTTAYDYKFDPDDEILDYIKKINKMLPSDVDASCKFSILFHIAITLMKGKYNQWENYMNYWFHHEDKYALTKRLENISFRTYSEEYNKEFLLTINQKEQIYKLYFS